MAAMLTRNRFVGWASFVFSLQSWLGESAEAKSTSSTPGYFSVGMACEYSRIGPLTLPAAALTSYIRSTGFGLSANHKVYLVMALAVTYLPIFMPPTGKAAAAPAA